MSTTVAVLVTLIEGALVNIWSVESSLVFPSVSSPSSLTSVTLSELPGLLPVAVTVLLTPALSTAVWPIT